MKRRCNNSISNESRRAQTLRVLVGRLLPDTDYPWDEVLRAIDSIGDRRERVSILSETAWRLPAPKQQVIIARLLSEIKAFTSEEERADALVFALDRIPLGEIGFIVEALSLAVTFGIETSRMLKADVLVAIARRLPSDAIDLHLRLLELIPDLGGQPQVVELLASTVPQWDKVCRARGETEWATIANVLRGFATAKRQLLFGTITSFAPVIHRLGGERAVRETAQAIIDTAKWWP